MAHWARATPWRSSRREHLPHQPGRPVDQVAEVVVDRVDDLAGIALVLRTGHPDLDWHSLAPRAASPIR
jgi:hypothetical protein